MTKDQEIAALKAALVQAIEEVDYWMIVAGYPDDGEKTNYWKSLVNGEEEAQEEKAVLTLR